MCSLVIDEQMNPFPPQRLQPRRFMTTLPAVGCKPVSTAQIPVYHAHPF